MAKSPNLPPMRNNRNHLFPVACFPSPYNLFLLSYPSCYSSFWFYTLIDPDILFVFFLPEAEPEPIPPLFPICVLSIHTCRSVLH